MDRTLVISESQIEILLDFYLNRIKEIDGVIKSYESQKKEFESMISQLQGNFTKATIASENRIVNGNLFGGSNSEYDSSWSVPKKGNFILSKEQRELSTSEVFDKLLEYEPKLSENRALVMVLLSSGFKDKTGKTMYRTGEKRGEYKYGLLEWKQKKDVRNDIL